MDDLARDIMQEVRKGVEAFFILEPGEVDRALKVLEAAVRVTPGLEPKIESDLLPTAREALQGLRISCGQDGRLAADFASPASRDAYRRLDAGSTWFGRLDVVGAAEQVWSGRSRT